MPASILTCSPGH